MVNMENKGNLYGKYVPTSFLIGELFAQQTLLAVLSAGSPIGHVHA